MEWIHDGNGEVTTAEYEWNGQKVVDLICNCEVVNGVSVNAQLISAAPDLLEALQGYMLAVSKMNEAMKDGYNVQGAMSALIGWEDMARAAISKALGSAVNE